MTETVMVQVRFPKKLVRMIDKLQKEGLYKNRTDFVLDASRRLIERNHVKSKFKIFMEDYRAGRIKKTKGAYENARKICKKIRESKEFQEKWGGMSVDEVMDRIRKRKLYIDE